MNWKWLVPLTPKTRGSLDDIVSHAEPVVAKLQDVANDIGRRAASNLDVRSRKRTGRSRIRVVHQGGITASGRTSLLDSHIYLEDTDPNKGDRKGSVLSIEREHHVLGDAVDHVAIRYKGSLR